MDTLLANLRAQLEESHSKASLITQRCADENRDLNDDEQRNFDGYKTQIEGLQPRIEHLVETQRSFDASSTALATVSNDGQRELMRREAPQYMTTQYRTPGEWIVDYLTSHHPGSEANNGPSPERRTLARERLTRAVANQTVADNLGIIPIEVAGPVINFVDRRRGIWNSFTQRTITSGPLFNRPRVTQHTLVGKQTAEKTELASRKMLIERVPVNVDTYGGVVDVSLQDQYWSNPDIMNVIIDDLRGQYIEQTETVAGTLLNTVGLANPTPVGTPLTGALVIDGIYDAAVIVYGAVKQLPTHVAMSVDVWSLLGGMADTAGRPLFPTLNPANASATMSADQWMGTVAGLSVVVSPALPIGTMIVYRADAFEAWEQLIGVLQLTEPRLLGTEVAYAGFAAVLGLSSGAAATALHLAP